LKCARKVNDYATAVRILEGVKEKVENKGQYSAYLDELKPVIQELGEFSWEDAMASGHGHRCRPVGEHWSASEVK
jgi:hypothetical protein